MGIVFSVLMIVPEIKESSQNILKKSKGLSEILLENNSLKFSIIFVNPFYSHFKHKYS